MTNTLLILRLTEDIKSDHIPTVNLRQGWWKPFEEERPATPKPAWSIRSSDVPVSTNNWASALASNYSPPPEDSFFAQTGDMAIFIDWFCKRRECHKLLTDSVDDPILRNNVSKPLPLGGPSGQVTIQSDFFFNKDLDYLRYGSKGSRLALSISKMKAAYYPDVGLEQMVPDQFWINKECKYDIAAMYGISHWWFQRQRFYIDRHTSEGDCSADESMFKYEVLDQEGRRSVQRVHVRDSEAFEDTDDLSQPGKLCWRTRKIKKEKSENKGRVPTEMELELEHTQLGSSYEVSSLQISFLLFFLISPSDMAAPPARARADYDYLIKLLLIGDS
nr:hypothetical protein [Tanacetum cinerariifolium]